LPASVGGLVITLKSWSLARPACGYAVQGYIRRMCGRFTYQLTWPELVRLYRLTLDAPARNLQPRYNVCPTTNIDAVIERDGKRELLPLLSRQIRWSANGRLGVDCGRQLR
jgi:hypothetical protein